MAKIITPLTNTQIKQAKTLDKEYYTLADGDGLYQSDYLTTQIHPFSHTHFFDPIYIANKAIPRIAA